MTNHSETSGQQYSSRRLLRITFVLSSLQLSGGVLLVIGCANRLAARGHSVALVLPGETADPELVRQLHPTIQRIESTVPLGEQRSPRRLLQLSWAMASAVPPGDLVIATHTPTVVPTLLASLWRGAGRRAWLYMDYPRMFTRRPVERFLLWAAPRWFEAILPISEPLGAVVRRQTKARITVVRSGLSRPELFFDQERMPQPAGVRQIFYVGDDRPRKGLEEFLRAAEIIAAQEPDVRFAIASKIPCVIHTRAPYEFHLRPSDRQLSELYRSSEVFVSASWGEGLGYPPLEAMACGTPVVLTDSQGVRDYARHEENCLVVPPRNPPALAEAVLRLLHDPKLARRLAQNGPPTARQYDWERMVDLVENVCWQLIRQ